MLENSIGIAFLYIFNFLKVRHFLEMALKSEFEA
jgi:hypothetical protein